MHEMDGETVGKLSEGGRGRADMFSRAAGRSCCSPLREGGAYELLGGLGQTTRCFYSFFPFPFSFFFISIALSCCFKFCLSC